MKFLLNKDSCQTNLVLLCPILELKLIGLDSVDAVLVDVETTREAVQLLFDPARFNKCAGSKNV